MLCDLCGGDFDPDKDFVEESEDMFLDKDYCPVCRKVMLLKYRKEEEKNE